MRYAKLEVSLLNKAIVSIQGFPVGSKVGIDADAVTPIIPDFHLTAAAYQADE